MKKYSNTRRAIILKFFLLIFLLQTYNIANNLTISNLSVIGQNINEHFSLIKFTIAWENSWRSDIPGNGYNQPFNWDAAWIFIKFRINNGEWKHAYINDSGHFIPSGSAISLGLLDRHIEFDPINNPALGVFIFKDVNGTGSNNFQDVCLRWNYGINGVNDNDLVDVKVFAIEMVKVTEGSFYLGSGGNETAHFYEYPTTTLPYLITGEQAINVGQTNGNLFYDSSATGAAGDQNGPIPLNFPKGFDAFYCMKYELSQNGYVEFLNTLSRTQQNTRTATSLPLGLTSVTNRYVMSNSTTVSYRNGIRCDSNIPANEPIIFYCDLNANGIENENNDGQNIACNFVSWADISAYLDWSCLRPMTELEFEKACRGNAPPVQNEYSWGNTTIFQNTGINNPGSEIESGVNNSNCIYLDHPSVQGPMRVGCFATINSTRITSGASFYGIMEMSGNLYEHSITVGNIKGRSYTGIHGDGMLSSIGENNTQFWPGIDAEGDGRRGGNWFTFQSNLPTSNRFFAALIKSGRKNVYGIRGVRTS